MSRNLKKVEVIFAMPGHCWREPVLIAAAATAEEIVRASGLDRVCVAQTGREPAALGLYGRRIGVGDVVGDGQRLELYRPLIADPRERRRRRAAQS